MAEKKRNNLYTAISEMMDAPEPKKPRDRTENEQKKFNLYTQMGWAEPSAPKSGMAGKKKKK